MTEEPQSTNPRAIRGLLRRLFSTVKNHDPRPTAGQFTPEESKEILTITSPISLDLVHIPAGSFLMGTSERWVRSRWESFLLISESDFKREQPQHTVRLPAYDIGRYPVTNAQYAAFAEATGHDTPSYWYGGGCPTGYADHPVRYVSYHEASAFVAWLRDQAGQPFRLPTEAEWEKAARGTDGRAYPWGDCLPGRDLCNCDQQLYDTTPVGHYSPAGNSPYGCADMAGNVYEWCSTAHKQYPYDTGDGREEAAGDRSRVLRGGAWVSSPYRVRCAHRYDSYPDRAEYYFGFRVARDPLE